jgi:hypothetical protein
MPTNIKKTSEADLSAIIEGLIKADVKFILVGGLAAVIQGAPATTMDNKQLPVRKETPVHRQAQDHNRE